MKEGRGGRCWPAPATPLWSHCDHAGISGSVTEFAVSGDTEKSAASSMPTRTGFPGGAPGTQQLGSSTQLSPKHHKGVENEEAGW